jgi:hypothetical protein
MIFFFGITFVVFCLLSEGTGKDFFCTICSGRPIIEKQSLFSSLPAQPAKSYEISTHVLTNITAFQFTNPAGLRFDGVVGRTQSLTQVTTLAPGQAVSEASWFIGYSWRILYARGCSGMDAHLGWVFFHDEITNKASNKEHEHLSFAFLILRSLAECEDSQLHAELSELHLNKVSLVSNDRDSQTNRTIVATQLRF